MNDIRFLRNPPLASDDLNDLFEAAWESHQRRDFTPVLQQSLAYIAAYQETKLVGFVNVAWDGGVHGFILDTTVHPGWQHKGIGLGLLREAAEIAREKNLEWLHVDYEERLEPFYRAAGYRDTAAGFAASSG